MFKQFVTIAAVAVLGTASLAPAADTNADGYVWRNIPQGGSRYGVVMVPVGRDRVRTSDEAPYALTGRKYDDGVRHQKTIPSSPRGPRSDW
jgi:hypothetical protein